MMFINKYVLIPILITCIYAIAMVVAGVPVDIIYGLLPILFLGHMLGYMLAMKHVHKSNHKSKSK